MDEAKKRHKAVALRYDRQQEQSPRVVAKGMGRIAEKILALAREHNIPIQEDADLVEVLSRLELYAEIPSSTYVVVAEILAFVYRTNAKYKK